MNGFGKHGAAPERTDTRSVSSDRRQKSTNSDHPAYIPRIEMRDVYYELIASELRQGRLTRSRRKRIIQYASHLGLNAVEAGRMITKCREIAMQSDDTVERKCALRLVEPDRERIPGTYKIAIVLALAIVVDLVLLALLR